MVDKRTGLVTILNREELVDILNVDFMHRLAWEQMCLRLSQQVRGLRGARGWTQSQLAKRAKLSLRDVWRLENGYLKHVTIKMLTMVSHALDVVCNIRFLGLVDSLKEINQPVELPAGFHEELSSCIGKTA